MVKNRIVNPKEKKDVPQKIFSIPIAGQVAPQLCLELSAGLCIGRRFLGKEILLAETNPKAIAQGIGVLWQSDDLGSY